MFANRSILHEQARPAVIRESRRAPWLAVSVVCFGAFMGQLDASIVTITFPAVEHDFGVPVAGVHWVSLIYLLGLSAGHGPGSEARTGLLLSALPLGFGVAALFGDALLPEGWGNRQRGFAGAALTCTVMCASIFMPVSEMTVVPLLALAGLGLGIFVPANNTVIMRGAADSSASLLGGLINMARGIGTTLGISLTALALHLADRHDSGHGYAEATQARLAFAVLAVVSAAAAAIALASRARWQPARPREADPSGADR